MSKAILISIKPKYVADILNGKKTIEIRKTMPKCDLPIDVYIYCTKGEQDYLYGDKSVYKGKKETFWCQMIEGNGIVPLLNGKVVAKFTLNKVEEIKPQVKLGLLNTYNTYETETLLINPILEKSCLDYNELDFYLKWKTGYAWHISNLEIFDKPKELSEFKHWVFYKKCEKCPYGKNEYDYGLCSQCCEIKPLTKAPQSWCYVEVEKDE